jgi:hypothetical protein
MNELSGVDQQNLSWRKATRSGGGNCVEVALDADLIYMRDSKDRYGPMLTLDRAAFQDFIDIVTRISTAGR